MIERVREWLREPGRQALAWAGLGIAGLLLAAVGIFLLMDGGDGGTLPADDDSSPTPQQTAARTGTRTPGAPGATLSPTPGETPTEGATATNTRRPTGGGGGGGATSPTAAPTNTTAPPTATPTMAVNLTYCGSSGGGGGPQSPPGGRVAGLVTQDGEPVEGETVTAVFGGVAGPSAVTGADGGYRIDFSQGGSSNCANVAGASIAVAVAGQVFQGCVMEGGFFACAINVALGE